MDTRPTLPPLPPDQLAIVEQAVTTESLLVVSNNHLENIRKAAEGIEKKIDAFLNAAGKVGGAAKQAVRENAPMTFGVGMGETYAIRALMREIGGK